MFIINLSGSTPYPGMGAREVMRRVRDGYRLERPSHCHPDLYKIISKCWAGDMNKRPDFTELRLVILCLFFEYLQMTQCLFTGTGQIVGTPTWIHRFT